MWIWSGDQLRHLLDVLALRDKSRFSGCLTLRTESTPVVGSECNQTDQGRQPRTKWPQTLPGYDKPEPVE